MAMTFHPDPPFREGRPYIHSTDLYDILLDTIYTQLPDVKVNDIKLIFKKLLTTQPDLIVSNPGDDFKKPNNTATICQLNTDKGQIYAYYTKTSAPVLRNVHYNEEKIHALAKFDGQSIQITGDTGASPIEVCTSLSVKLHNKLFPPAAGQKWLDSQIQLSRPLRDEDRITMEIRLERQVGTAHTRSAIISNGEKIGQIFFTLGSLG